MSHHCNAAASAWHTGTKAICCWLPQLGHPSASAWLTHLQGLCAPHGAVGPGLGASACMQQAALPASVCQQLTADATQVGLPTLARQG